MAVSRIRIMLIYIYKKKTFKSRKYVVFTTLVVMKNEWSLDVICLFMVLLTLALNLSGSPFDFCLNLHLTQKYTANGASQVKDQ